VATVVVITITITIVLVVIAVILTQPACPPHSLLLLIQPPHRERARLRL
jgi:hypothetical protein